MPCSLAQVWLKEYHNGSQFQQSFGHMFVHTLEDAEALSVQWSVRALAALALFWISFLVWLALTISSLQLYYLLYASML